MYEIYAEKLNGITRPQGLTDTRPVFSWRLRSDAMDVRQVHYRIVVTTADGKTVWDSGKVESSQVHAVTYGGRPLRPNTDYVWRVASGANTGDEATGPDQHFSTGVTDHSLWEARWIESGQPRKPLSDCTDSSLILRGLVEPPADREAVMEPCLYFRKSVEARAEVKRAIAYVTAHGIYELYVNGDAYGEPFAPGYTVYAKHQECQRYDITASLQQGENVLASIVADGWYTGKIGLMGIGEQYGDTNAFFLQVFVEYSDGSNELFCSDDGFRWSTGAYRYADLFVGEKYDAGLEPKGFALPGFDDSSWEQAVIKEYGYDQLTGPMSEPVRVLREFPAKSLLRTPADEMVVDVGENVVGFLKAKLRGKKGQSVTLEYSETLDREGGFLQNVMAFGQNREQKDCYVFAEDGEFEYCPKFTFHGFQYVRIEGASDAQVSDFTAVVFGSDLEKTGSFECSDARLTQLQSNIFQSQQGNMLSIPTDCPQREKAGWTGDVQVFTPTACFNMDVESFLRKWLHEMRLEQFQNGRIPHVVPDIPSNNFVESSRNATSAGWGDACVIVPYRLYEAYGDEAILRENYWTMLRWMGYVEEKVSTGTPEGYDEMSPERKKRQKYLWNTGFHFGDWLIPSTVTKGDPVTASMPTREIVATAMFAYSTDLMTRVSEIIGEGQRAAHFRDLNGKIKEAFAQEYLGDDGSLTPDLQGMYVLALQMGLVPEAKVDAVVGQLTRLIEESGGCLDTGFLSTPFLLDVLYDNGSQDEAFALLFQTKRPSWLYEVGWGSTTIWESWNNVNEDGSRRPMSFNHFAPGCVGDFVYRHVLGLRSTSPGYQRVRIEPDLRCGLEWASGALETVFGRISVEWRLQEGQVHLAVEIPPGVEAEVMNGVDSASLIGSGAYEFQFNIG